MKNPNIVENFIRVCHLVWVGWRCGWGMKQWIFIINFIMKFVSPQMTRIVCYIYTMCVCVSFCRFYHSISVSEPVRFKECSMMTKKKELILKTIRYFSFGTERKKNHENDTVYRTKIYCSELNKTELWNTQTHHIFCEVRESERKSISKKRKQIALKRVSAMSRGSRAHIKSRA